MSNIHISSLLIMTLSVFAIFIAIAADFALYNDNHNTKRTKKSIVATGSMVMFFLFYLLVIKYSLGYFKSLGFWFENIGVIAVALGSLVNIVSRFSLKGNWANHIKIYENHTLVTKGFYKVVRHPLYASIMLMLIGGSIAFSNWLSFVLTAFVFIPFMYYRAKQEEALLLKEFSDYKDYIKNTGMFFPKLWR